MIKEVLSEANEELRTDECITTKKTKKMKTATEKEIARMKERMEKEIAVIICTLDAMVESMWRMEEKVQSEVDIRNKQRIKELIDKSYRAGWERCLSYLAKRPWDEAMRVICGITDEHEADTGRKEDDSDEV